LFLATLKVAPLGQIWVFKNKFALYYYRLQGFDGVNSVAET
jgi:hypothetical protein